MGCKIIVLVIFCCCAILHGQDILPTDQNGAAPPSVTPKTPAKEAEETTPSPTKTALWPHDSPGHPDYDKHLFTWFEYKKFSNGKCYSCRCLQLRHYRETCECFNDLLHAKSNLVRRLYIKKSPWYRCKKSEKERYNYEKRSDSLINRNILK